MGKQFNNGVVEKRMLNERELQAIRERNLSGWRESSAD